MIQVGIMDDLMADGINVAIRNKHDGAGYMLAVGFDDFGQMKWEYISPEAQVLQRTPTMRLNGEVARALLDALLRHYQGASDMHTVRSDLLHERERRERLEDLLHDIVSDAHTRRP